MSPSNELSNARVILGTPHSLVFTTTPIIVLSPIFSASVNPPQPARTSKPHLFQGRQPRHHRQQRPESQLDLTRCVSLGKGLTLAPQQPVRETGKKIFTLQGQYEVEMDQYCVKNNAWHTENSRVRFL